MGRQLRQTATVRSEGSYCWLLFQHGSYTTGCHGSCDGVIQAWEGRQMVPLTFYMEFEFEDFKCKHGYDYCSSYCSRNARSGPKRCRFVSASLSNRWFLKHLSGFHLSEFHLITHTSDRSSKPQTFVDIRSTVYPTISFDRPSTPR